LTCSIYRTSEGLEKALRNVMRFVAVKQFQMEIATAFIGKGLKNSRPSPKRKADEASWVFSVAVIFLCLWASNPRQTK